ncbi:MAG: fatty acid desaturase [Alphaproteobacteria bacterium]|jgi:fatty acid desaturase|nr:fatty acid desaturase [Alphaproteobacteria bacterium]
MTAIGESRAVSGWRRLELPTWGVAATIYAGYGALCWNFEALPWWLAASIGAWLVAWHGSLQHEAVHGHPTRRPWANALIAGLPLSLWLPYPIYREWHLAHHQAAVLASPTDDPETFYVTPADWARASRAERALHVAMQSVAGRLLLGPPWLVASFLAAEAKRLAAGDPARRRIWLGHGLAVAAVLAWLTYAGVPLWFYLLFMVWPGISLTLLRSYHEHRPAEQADERTATLFAAPPLALLYLNNNLHWAHHARPDLAWYELPRFYRETVAERGDQGYVVQGYGEVFRRFLLRPKDRPVYPY